MATKRCIRCSYFYRFDERDELQALHTMCDPCSRVTLAQQLSTANAAPALGYPGGIVKLDSQPASLEPGGVVFFDPVVDPTPRKLTAERALLIGGTLCAFYVILAGVLTARLGVPTLLAIALSLTGCSAVGVFAGRTSDGKR